MREIKFRGLTEKGEWGYGFLAREDMIWYWSSPGSDGGILKATGIGGVRFYNEYTIDPKTVGQYTGLKDKDGTEIYEGDIVLEDGNKIVVKYGEQEHEENYGDKIHYLGFNLTLAYGYPNAHQREIEVIGNIYENPELLEESK